VLPLSLPSASSRRPQILCIGAHCDDIEIGCGGAILSLQRCYPGCRIHWLVLTSVPTRRREALAAANAFVKASARGEVRIGELDDGLLPAHFAEVKAQFEDLKRAVEPDLILTHHGLDRHQDHALACQVTWQTFRNHLIWEYEVPKYDGDLSTPNVFERFDRLSENNYTQVLVGKKLGARGAVSVDWTGHEGVDTWRQAVRVGTRETHVVDAVRLELYQRTTGTHAEGFALSAERMLPHRLSLAGGYATIDRDYGGLNGDRFNRGRRVFAEARVPLVQDLSLSVFYGHAVGNDFPVTNADRFDIVVGYNALKALQRRGAL